MSLIHWWPLNGNTTDNGVDNFTLSTTPSFSAAGKIGKCATNTSINAGQAYLSNQTLPLAKDSPISIFTWVYMNDYSTTGANLNGLVSNHNHGHNSDKGSGFGLNLRNNGNSFQVSISTSSAGGRTYSTYCGNTTFRAGEWHHVGFTYNGSRINFYLDGNYDGGLNFTSSYNSNNPIGIFCWSTGYSGYSSSCQLNDVRIYNHALSAKEVKEISKGLVLHYNFEDEYIEPTTNIDPAKSTAPSFSYATTNEKVIFKGKECWHFIIENNGSIWSYSSATGYAENSVLTRSCWLYIPSGQTNRAGWYGLPFAFEGMKSISNRKVYDLNKMDTWQYCYCTGTAQSTSSNYLLYMLADDSTTAHRIEFYITDIQLEEKDHATPYVNGARSTGKVYDNSGYGNNGTVNNSLQVIPGGLSGAHYINLPLASTITYTSEAFNKTELTYSIWFRHHGANGSSATYMFTNGRADYGGLGYGIQIANDSQIVCRYGNSFETVSNCSKDVWHLITVSIKNAVQTIYLDGALVGSFTATVLPSYSDGNGLGLGCFYYKGGSIYHSNCDFADFKIYATALSAEDILAEYNRKAAIDKNGNLFTGEIIETAGSATKIDKNSFIDSNLFATTMTLEDGSLWVPICVHYVPDGLFKGSSKTFYYTGRNVWENFGAINDLERPESNQWEFYVMQQNTVDGAFSKYRFKQNVSPLSATWEQVNPSKVGTNVTRISSSTPNNYAGMYWYNNSNVAMCFANGSNGNWYGCGIRAVYQGGIPGYNGETVKGWQLVYMRISKHKARMFKNGIVIPTDIIEN